MRIGLIWHLINLERWLFYKMCYQWKRQDSLCSQRSLQLETQTLIWIAGKRRRGGETRRMTKRWRPSTSTCKKLRNGKNSCLRWWSKERERARGVEKMWSSKISLWLSRVRLYCKIPMWSYLRGGNTVWLVEMVLVRLVSWMPWREDSSPKCQRICKFCWSNSSWETLVNQWSKLYLKPMLKEKTCLDSRSSWQRMKKRMLRELWLSIRD